MSDDGEGGDQRGDSGGDSGGDVAPDGPLVGARFMAALDRELAALVPNPWIRLGLLAGSVVAVIRDLPPDMRPAAWDAFGGAMRHADAGVPESAVARLRATPPAGSA